MTRIISILFLGLFLGQAQIAHAQDTVDIADDRLVIESFEVSGNKVTKERIITRELVFGLGDTILKINLISKFQECKVNLLNTSLFNFVYLDVKHIPGNRIIVRVTVTERWYIWPVPILEYAERNFNEFITNREWDKIVYGAYLKWSNFRGRKEELTGKIRLGYINEYALAYHIPNIGKRQQHGISNGFNVNHQNEVFVSTEYNKPVEFKPDEKPAQIRLNTFSKYTYRRKHYSTHSLRMEYNNYTISDSVSIMNPNYLGTSIVNGEPLTNLHFFKLSYEFRHDVRDSKIYPLEGFMLKLKADKFGLGFIPDYPHPHLILTGVLMFHQKLSKRFYFYNTTKARYSSEKLLPHIMNRGLG